LHTSPAATVIACAPLAFSGVYGLLGIGTGGWAIVAI
jgi:hypothetical protein